jgi:3-hydroxyisobutyrate dehydrogenase-like beta-hydroxyacid dehydrogenase
MIIKEGFDTFIWARRAETLEAFKNAGATIVSSLLELGERAEVIGICVHNDDDVRQVVDGDGKGVLHGMQPGGVIAVHSTIMPETCLALDRLAAERGVRVIDAPVSGGRDAPENKSLSVLVGGDAAAFEMALPVFLSYGNPVRHLGPLGSGQRIKALNAVVNFANMRVAHIGFAVADKLGMDPAAVREVMLNSSGASVGMERVVNRFEKDPDFAKAHAAPTMMKDVGVLARVCREAGIAETLIERLAVDYIEVLKQGE